MSTQVSPSKIAEKLGLEPLDREGGMFRSTYHQLSSDGTHELGNAIYYMLEGKQFSHLHRLNHDEIYHYHMGAPLELLELCPDGSYHHYLCGPDILDGQVPQAVIHAGCWQGSRVANGGEYTLVGTVSIPGWTPEGYEHCTNPEDLVEQFPECEELIRFLCGNNNSVL